MIFLFKPSQNRLLRILQSAKNTMYTYKNVGSTYSSTAIPKWFSNNQYRYYIGRGDNIFKRASEAISYCKMYGSKHSELFREDISSSPIPDTTMIVVAKNFFLWSANPIRIVYKGYKAEDNDMLFSLAVGTLPGHEERGEEKFSIRKSENGDVWYELFSFYRPSHFYLRIAYPLVKYILRQFDKESADAVKENTYAR